MLLFVESVLSLTLWFGSAKLFWFLRIGKQKAKNENGTKIEPKDANEKEEEDNENAVSFYKVLLNTYFNSARREKATYNWLIDRKIRKERKETNKETDW